MAINRSINDTIWGIINTISDLARRVRRLEGLPAPSSITDMLDVDITGAANRQFLRYNSTSGQWENLTIKAQALFTIEGALTAPYVGTIRIPNATGRTLYISKVYAIVDTAPTGASIIADININGASIFTLPAHQPTITATNNSGFTTDVDLPSWVDGSYLTLELDQVGSGVAGSNLTVAIVYD